MSRRKGRVQTTQHLLIQARETPNKLGAVTYKSRASTVIDEKAGIFVDNMEASGVSMSNEHDPFNER